MKDEKVDIAIELIERKIARYIKNNKEKNFEKFSKELKRMTEDREKIYDLDENTIERIYQEAMSERKEKC